MNQAQPFSETRSPIEGLVYQPDFLSTEEERSLLDAIRTLPFESAQYKEYTARRRTVSYGSQYDFANGRLLGRPPIPSILHPLREKAAGWIGMPVDHFEHALVTEYQPGTPLGWHRDVPNFEIVVGISLCGPCLMRFRPYPPATGRAPRAFSLELAPRSVYVLSGDARWRWQHAISPTRGLRYSITFRTPRLPPRASSPPEAV